MGRSKVEGLIAELIVSLEEDNYEKALKVVSSLAGLLPSLTPEEALRLDRLLLQLEKTLKLKEEAILNSMSNRNKVRGSYLKCSL